jgi:hypothetical protein
MLNVLITATWLFLFLILVCEAIGTAATPGLLCQPRVIVKMIVEKRWNVDWQRKPKFSEKACPSATFVHHKIPNDQTRVWTRAASVGSRRLTAWAMARPLPTSSLQHKQWRHMRSLISDTCHTGTEVLPLGGRCGVDRTSQNHTLLQAICYPTEPCHTDSGWSVHKNLSSNTYKLKEVYCEAQNRC